MARQTFFSFHFERDVWRAGNVRSSWRFKKEADRQDVGFWDAAKWEETKKKGDEAVHKWIDDQLKGTSVTVVLIGAETSERPYVGYEIQQSHNRGNGLLGVYIHNMKDTDSKTDTKGKNPFDNWHITENGTTKYLSSIYKTYDWVNDDGRTNIGDWIEAAATKAGR
jgi:MTH538 TIR-like domain (DUF1863)